MKMRVKCCYEDFAQSVIHPLEFGIPNSAPPTMRHSPVKHLISTSTAPGGVSSPGVAAASLSNLRYSSSPEMRWSMSPRVSSLLRLARSSSKGHLDKRTKKPVEMEEVLRRPRSRTVEESMSPSQIQCKGS